MEGAESTRNMAWRALKEGPTFKEATPEGAAEGLL